MNGFINLNKSKNFTSHDAVNVVRKIFQTKKVGHGGTLDPAAEGVLPIAVGRATKFLEYVTGSDKTYRAEIIFGLETDSGDLDGEIISRQENFSMPTLAEVQEVAKNFVGEIEQTPPKYSAIKIAGRKAYDLARKNVEFKIPARLVKINSLEVLQVEKNIVSIEVDCAKGTYIRSLATDIGKYFDIPATLKSLCRTRVGKFNIHRAVTLEDLKTAPEKYLQSVESCLPFERFNLPLHRLKAFSNGLTTTVAVADKLVKVYSDEKFLGVGQILGGELKAKKLFP